MQPGNKRVRKKNPSVLCFPSRRVAAPATSTATTSHLPVWLKVRRGGGFTAGGLAAKGCCSIKTGNHKQIGRSWSRVGIDGFGLVCVFRTNHICPVSTERGREEEDTQPGTNKGTETCQWIGLAKMLASKMRRPCSEYDN